MFLEVALYRDTVSHVIEHPVDKLRMKQTGQRKGEEEDTRQRGSFGRKEEHSRDLVQAHFVSSLFAGQEADDESGL